MNFWTIAGLLLLGVEMWAMLSGGDASWDFRNYHLYNPFALLHKRVGVDIAPAHMQTFFPPTMDLVYFGLASFISYTPLLNAIVALPHALAVLLTFTLTRRLLKPKTAREEVTVGLFVVLGATGVAGGSTIATTMSEMLPASLVLLALLTIVQRELETQPSLSRLFWAGLLIGCACGLKLTMTYVATAFAISLAVLPRRKRVQLVIRPASFGIGVLIGAVALSGYWWVYEWAHFGNPYFPMFNDIFKSPHAAAERYVDGAFLPSTIGDLLKAPWTWTLHLSRAASESRMRDPRFSIFLVAAFWTLVAYYRKRPYAPWPFVFLPILFLLGFALWRVEFSIYRYLSVLELLGGTIAALYTVELGRDVIRPSLMTVGVATLVAGCLAITVYPQVHRSQYGTPVLAVNLGPIPPESMVLLLDNEPMAYLAAFADPEIRFVATNDFFMTLDHHNPMQREVEEAIARHRGPLWGLNLAAERERSDQTLQRYSLLREDCRPVETNLSPLEIQLCRLRLR